MSCRICNKKLKKVINYKKVALAGNFLNKDQIKNEKKYQLTLMVCVNCKHLQVKEKIDPKILFPKNYVWQTGISITNVNLIKNLLSKLDSKFIINKKSKFLEIASNDGTLLKEVKKKFNSNVLGIDPAKNLKNILKKNKINTIVDFFSYSISKKIKKIYGKFDFCIARNVIAHTKNPNDIFKGVKNILNKDGIFVIEVPHLYNIFKDNQYDNVFHEHLGFHSLKSIDDLCKKNELQMFDVNIIDSQGGSIQCFISSNNKKIVNPRVLKTLKKEKKLGLLKLSVWNNFTHRVYEHSNKLNHLLKKLKKNKKIIHIYGASGKGQSLMQFNKIDNKIIDYVYDKSKFKQNKYTPGTHIKIIDPKKINVIKPDYLLLLSWNLVKEIMKQEKKYLKNNGKIIIPFPNPRLVKKY